MYRMYKMLRCEIGDHLPDTVFRQLRVAATSFACLHRKTQVRCRCAPASRVFLPCRAPMRTAFLFFAREVLSSETCHFPFVAACRHRCTGLIPGTMAITVPTSSIQWSDSYRKQSSRHFHCQLDVQYRH